VQLDSDPDVGPGPGDTRVLPAEKTPTSRANCRRSRRASSKPRTPKEAAPTAEEAAVVDDALGLTPEARRREHEKAEDLGGSRRGWRGMASEGPTVPGTPAAHPVDEEVKAEGPAPELEPEPELEQVEAIEEQAAAQVADPEAIEEEAPVAQVAEPEPVAEEPSLEDLADAADQADDAVLAVEPVKEREPEPPAKDVAIGEEVGTVAAALPPDTFDITEDVSPPLAAEERPDAVDELHLPPVIDETVDEMDVEPLALTPEQGAPLDLTVEEPPIDIDAPTPELKLEAPRPQQVEEGIEVEPKAELAAPEPNRSPKRRRSRPRQSRSQRFPRRRSRSSPLPSRSRKPNPRKSRSASAPRVRKRVPLRPSTWSKRRSRHPSKRASNPNRSPSSKPPATRSRCSTKPSPRPNRRRRSKTSPPTCCPSRCRSTMRPSCHPKHRR
jgi:hypothetical protein